MTSLRKHESQMSRQERVFLLSEVFNQEWALSNHLIKRIEERGGTVDTIMETINYGDLIEYHNKDGKSRLLLRSDKVVYKWVPCVVVEMITKRVITVYWNHHKDDHRTIDMDAYIEDLDVITMYEEEKENEMAMAAGSIKA